MSRRRIVLILVTAISVSGLGAATMLIAYRDWAYVCENTGSRKGHREWSFGMKTKHWAQPSKLEKFLESKHPELLEHRWTSYAGTGRSLIPCAKLYGHGNPGPILMLDFETLNHQVQSLPDSERLELFQLFQNADEELIQKKVGEIHYKILNTTEPGIPK